MRTFILASCLAISAVATDFPTESGEVREIYSDSEIRGPQYASIVTELQRLARSYPRLAKAVTYGQSPAGKPLSLIKIENSEVAKNLPAVYIGGAIHGNEYLNIEDRLPVWFLEQSQVPGSVARFLDAGGAIYIAPILNPDGYDRRRRENNRGIDLNRDFPVKAGNVEGLREVETSSLVTFLAQDLARDGRKLELAWDYHCCIGAVLYPWSFTGPTLPSEDAQRHLDVVEIMLFHLGAQLRHGTTPTILGYSARGTSKDFYYERFGARAFTYEGRRGRENQFFNEHARMWADILASIQ
jgi:predicted deacylase